MATTPTSDRDAVRRMIDALARAQATPVACNAGDLEDIDLSSMTTDQVLDELFDYEDVAVRFDRPDGAHVTLRLVFGNDPDEVVCNWWPADGGDLDHVVEAETDSWWQTEQG